MPILSRHNVNFDAEELRLLAGALMPGGSSLRARVARWTPGREAAEGSPGRAHLAAAEEELEPVCRFERSCADFHGVAHAIATGSGRAALFLGLEALDLPVGARVGVPEYTFYTVPEVVRACGLSPAFLPCHPRTYALDPDRLEAEAALEGLAALIVLHPFGQAAPLDRLLELCAARKLPMLEDPSQSLGGLYRGRRLGSFGVAAGASLVSGKNLTACGGGLLLTRDARIAAHARSRLRAVPEVAHPEAELRDALLRWGLSTRWGFALTLYPAFRLLDRLAPGKVHRLFEERPLPFDPTRGLTRLSGMQARVGEVQLRHLDARNAVRRANAERLLERLAGLPGLSLPCVAPGCEPTFNAVAVRLEPESGWSAAAFARALLQRGVDTRPDYMRTYAEDGGIRQEQILYLPNHPGLRQSDILALARIVKQVLLR